MTMSELVAHLMSVEWPIAHVKDLSDEQLIELFRIPSHSFNPQQWKQWDVVHYAVLIESRHRFEQMVEEKS